MELFSEWDEKDLAPNAFNPLSSKRVVSLHLAHHSQITFYSKPEDGCWRIGSVDSQRRECTAMFDYSYNFGTEFLKGKRDTCVWQIHSMMFEAKIIVSSVPKYHLVGTLKH